MSFQLSIDLTGQKGLIKFEVGTFASVHNLLPSALDSDQKSMRTGGGQLHVPLAFLNVAHMEAANICQLVCSGFTVEIQKQ